MATLKYVNDYEFFRVNDTSGGGLDAKPSNPRLPMTPWVLIQFRTAVFPANMSAVDYLKKRNNGLLYDIDAQSEWTTVSFRVSNDIEPMDDLYEEMERSKKSTDSVGGSLKFDNFFENIEIEDNGGFLKCNMKLFDKEFGRLESIIMRSIVAMKAANSMFDSRGQKDDYLLQFSIGGPQSINFRVRFGYADEVKPNDENFIDESDINSPAWMNRAKKSTSGVAIPKMVMRTPWFYFQMMNCRFITTDSGLGASVEGISMGNSIFDRLKIFQRFCGMQGTPKNLLKALGASFFKASGGVVQFVDEVGKVITDPRDSNNEFAKLGMPTGADKDSNFKSDIGATWEIFPVEDFKKKYSKQEAIYIAEKLEENKLRIEIMMGSEPKKPTDSRGVVNEKADWIQEFSSIKSIMDQICAKVPPRYSYETETEVKIIEDTLIIKKIYEGKEELIEIGGLKYNRSFFKPIPYDYTIKEIVAGGSQRIVRIRFYYKQEGLQEQEYIRRYVWRNNPNNIISSFAVSSDFDFAQMNATIVTRDSTGKTTVCTSEPAGTSSTDSNSGTGPKTIGSDLVKATYNSKDFLLVSSIQNISEADKSQSVAQSVINNMNTQSFKGSIEIPGDPFYIFGNNIQPYQYGVYVDVIRDRNFYWEGIPDKNSVQSKSYLSGFYLISNIKHILDGSGYKTSLTVMKWPTQTTKLEK